MENETKVFRSIIKKYFPVDLLVELDNLSTDYSVDNNSKTPEILELLNQYNVPYNSLGNGTNRYGIIVDGYAVKIALDNLGKIDNKREFKYAKQLYPKTIKVYECCETGLIAISEYITIFSLSDFYAAQDEMREILADIARNFLIGDIGVSTKNYVNWGTRPDGSKAILDFAYIYSLSYKGFMCDCDDEGVLEFDNDFNYLICPFCKKKRSFADIRKRISKQDEINEIGDITTIGYVLHSEEEEHEIDPLKSPVKKKKQKKVKTKIEKDVDDDLDDIDQEELLNALFNKLNEY